MTDQQAKTLWIYSRLHNCAAGAAWAEKSRNNVWEVDLASIERAILQANSADIIIALTPRVPADRSCFRLTGTRTGRIRG